MNDLKAYYVSCKDFFDLGEDAGEIEDELTAEAEAWLDRWRPDWRNPFAYWDPEVPGEAARNLAFDLVSGRSKHPYVPPEIRDRLRSLQGLFGKPLMARVLVPLRQGFNRGEWYLH